MVHRARIRLLSTNTESLSKITHELRLISEKTGVKMSGPVALPTKKVIIPVRKSPCGNGTQTWEHYEMRIHKRIVDLEAEAQAMTMLMKLNVPEDLRIEVEIA